MCHVVMYLHSRLKKQDGIDTDIPLSRNVLEVTERQTFESGSARGLRQTGSANGGVIPRCNYPDVVEDLEMSSIVVATKEYEREPFL